MKKLARLLRAAFVLCLRALRALAGYVRTLIVASAQAGCAVFVPVAALCAIAFGLESGRNGLLAAGALLWLDFWGHSIGGFALLWKYGPKQEPADAEGAE